MKLHACVPMQWSLFRDMTMRVGESREEMAGGQIVVANAFRYKD